MLITCQTFCSASPFRRLPEPVDRRPSPSHFLLQLHQATVLAENTRVGLLRIFKDFQAVPFLRRFEPHETGRGGPGRLQSRQTTSVARFARSVHELGLRTRRKEGTSFDEWLLNGRNCEATVFLFIVVILNF